MSSMIQYKFLPWLRLQATTSIPSNTEALGTGAPARFQTDLTLRVNSATIEVPINFYGPADVVGVEPEQILRCDPAPGSQNIEPNYFPLMEFHAPDLLWRFTPTATSGDTPLRPWLTLIALASDPTMTVRSVGTGPLPRVNAPLNQLPDLSESNLWCHVQLMGPFGGPLTTNAEIIPYVTNNPRKAIARLLCPRRLAPDTQYLVCLVPSFEVGRLAGLGENLDEQVIDVLKLQPAWAYNPTDDQTTVELPVYYSWTFRTGAISNGAEEFERLARALTPYVPSATSGSKDFHLDPLLLSESATVTTAMMEGALRPASLPYTPQAAPAEIQTALQTWINRSAEVEDQGGDPLVTPPLYGRWQTGQRQLGTESTPQWLNELNLNPRFRIAAAAGGDIVQKHQDEFVSEAWRQVGELREANHLLRNAQMARAVGGCLIKKHFTNLPKDLLLQIAGPDQQRIRYQDQTLYTAVESSGIPEAGFEGAYRRMSRIRGPHLRRYGSSQSYEDSPILFEQALRSIDLLENPDDWQVINQFSNQKWEFIGSNKIQAKIAEAGYPTNQSGYAFITGDHDWKDLVFNVTVDPLSGYGIIFRYRGLYNHYHLQVNPEKIRFDKAAYNPYIPAIPTYQTLWQMNITDEPQRSVRLHFVRINLFGHQFDISVDRPEGKYTASITDNTNAKGKIGFAYANSNQYQPIRFSNLSLGVQPGLSQTDIVPELIHDEGTVSGPSQWSSGGTLFQRSNIQDATVGDRTQLEKRGTYITVLPDDDPAVADWNNYIITGSLGSETGGAIGIMFRYKDSQNYYRLSKDSEESYHRLVKCVDGQFTLLWQKDFGYQAGSSSSGFSIIVDGSSIRGRFGGTFEVRDHSHLTGQVACYSYANSGARFSNILVKQLRYQGALSRLNEDRLGIELPEGGTLDFEALGERFLNESDPNVTVPIRTQERLEVTDASSAQDVLEPLHKAPTLGIPLSPRLADLNPHLMLPGLDGVPNDSVTLLETNKAFVASLMVGANHEMSRELLWRGLATDLRATVFRQFWDVRGGMRDASSSTDDYTDIPAIADWPDEEFLAKQVGTPTAETRTVFLIRSTLLQRFPQAQFYLVQAIAAPETGRKPGTQKEPYQFFGSLGTDMAYFGFALGPKVVLGTDGGLGYYFVIEQRAAAVRFGLNNQGAATLPDWSDLAWSHLAEGAYVQTGNLGAVQVTNPGAITWGKNGAHMAVISQRKPFRLFIHAQQLLADTVTGEFDAMLESYSGQKIDTIKLVREVTGLGLLAAKNLVESLPAPLLTNIPREDAEIVQIQFQENNATVNIQASSPR